MSEVWEDDGGTVRDFIGDFERDQIEQLPPAKGTVQSLKDILAEKEVQAHERTPEGMQFLGWELNGWVAPYPLIDNNARPIYAFLSEEV